MKKKILIAMLISIIIFVMTGCRKYAATTNVSNGKVNVVVSFNPMMEFTKAIGKDKINITTIVPNGTEPHDFEPKIRDMENLNKANLFVYNGLGMESWANKAVEAIDKKSLISINASNGIGAIQNVDEGEIRENGSFDPHIWLGLNEAKICCKNIKNGLIKVDPSNKKYYEKNYKEFLSKLDKLYNEYKVKMGKLANKNLVTGHAAFAYLCRDFNLKQSSVEDVFAEGEPTPKKLEELVQYCKANKIKVIFTEELASPKVSETLAKEVGAKTEKIYTIESKEDNKDYIESMKYNLELIYNSLKSN